MLDWERIWQEICDFKILKGYWNLVLDKNLLKDFLSSGRYNILALPETLEVKSEDDVRRVEDIAQLPQFKQLRILEEFFQIQTGTILLGWLRRGESG